MHIRKHWKNGSDVRVLLAAKILRGWKRRPSKLGTYAYSFVALRRDGITFQRKIAHLVLEAFIGPQSADLEACHNDGNPQNNRLDNLRWDTHIANVADMVIHGTKTKPPTHSGDSHPNAKVTSAQICEIASTPIHRGTKAALARKYGISQTHIGRILNGKARL
jgi:HNH endonuclease